MLKTYLIAALAALVLIGCASEVTQSSGEQFQNVGLSEASVVSVKGANFFLKKTDRLRWKGDVLFIAADGMAEVERRVSREEIQVDIETQFSDRGYQLVSRESDAEYEILAAVVLGESNRGNELIHYAKVNPGLVDSMGSLEKGTIMLGLMRANELPLVWRSAVQVYIAESPEDVNSRERVRRLIKRLMNELPEG